MSLTCGRIVEKWLLIITLVRYYIIRVTSVFSIKIWKIITLQLSI